jgi:hypothetical protein
MAYQSLARSRRADLDRLVGKDLGTTGLVDAYRFRLHALNHSSYRAVVGVWFSGAGR